MLVQVQEGNMGCLLASPFLDFGCGQRTRRRANAGTALGRQPEEKEKCPRASTLTKQVAGGG